MWIHQLKDQVWELVRWRVQNDAYWSNCSAEVLFGAANALREGAQTLGYAVPAPPPNRDADYYKKDYIQKVAGDVLHALYHYQFVDCSLTKARGSFQDAANRIRDCRKALTDLEAGDEVYFVPAES